MFEKGGVMSTEISWTDETWKEVPTHPGYFVTSTGLIKGPSGRVLRPMRADSGHLYILAARPLRPRKLFVHRGVLLAFVGPCPEGCETRHLDGNPANNDLNNLCWGDRFEQHEDRRMHGTLPVGEAAVSARLTAAQVNEIRRRVGGESLRSLAAEFGVSHTAIRRAAIGVTWGCINA